MATFLTVEELQSHIGVQRLLDFFDDDRDGILGDDELARVVEVVAVVNDTVSGAVVGKGWTAGATGELSEDRALRFAAKQIAAAICGERKPEFYDANGDPPFAAQGKRGNQYLKDMAKGDQRSRTEGTGAGGNQAIRGRFSTSTPSSVFGRDPNDANDQYGDGKGF
jgi:hypothetical protein